MYMKNELKRARKQFLKAEQNLVKTFLKQLIRITNSLVNIVLASGQVLLYLETYVIQMCFRH